MSSLNLLSHFPSPLLNNTTKDSKFTLQPSKRLNLHSQNQTPKATKTTQQKAIYTNAIEKTQNPTNGFQEVENHNDDIDFDFDLDPPLVCCFGAAQKEFVPTIRVSEHQMHPDIYSQWKMLQWDPPEFVRAPGGSASNVAISHSRLGGRAAFMGKVGRDEFGRELVLMMNKERVQTRGVVFDKTGVSGTGKAYMRVKFDEVDGRMGMEMVREGAEDSMIDGELDLAVLKEVI